MNFYTLYMQVQAIISTESLEDIHNMVINMQKVLFKKS